MTPRGRFVLLGACFFATGATALLYELVWSRYLTLVFGSAHHSVATVVAAYMLGLGLGGLILGRRADRTRLPARLYAQLELAVAAYALLSPLLLDGVRTAFVAFHRAALPGPALATTVKLALALVTLALPAALMGGTLPVLSRALVTAGGGPAGRDVGRLYALNTLGAVLGTALAGFVLIERLGLFRSLVLGAAVNAAAALAVLLALGSQPAPLPPIVSAPPLRALLREKDLRLALAVALVSGFAALADEVVWTRVLALLVGSSTYAFTVILICFLLGLGLGAWAWARLVPPDRAAAARRIAWAQILAAGGAMLLLVLFAPANRLILFAGQNPLAGFWHLLAVRALVALVTVVPATIGFGATFPLLVALTGGDATDQGARVGLLYGASTAGSILGAIAGGFVLLVWLSSHAVLRVAAGSSLILALLMLARAARLGPRAPVVLPLGAAAALGAALLALAPWPRHLLDLGAAFYFRNAIESTSRLESLLRVGKGEVLYLREGPAAMVTVRDSGHTRALGVNGKTDASTSLDMATQVALALVPGLVHPQPRTVLVIGAGSGVTARVAAELPGVVAIDVVEIEPAVIEAGRFFEDVNGGVYRDPRVHVVIEDGRNHLLTTTKRYDLIVSEPSNPWLAGVANLFTREFYALVHDRLNPGGVFCQWFQLYNLTSPTTERLAATVAGSFAEVSLWRAAPGDAFFLASREPQVLDRVRVAAVLGASRRARPAEIATHLGLEDEADVAGMYVFGTEGVRRFGAGHRPFRDDPPELEFAALRDLYADPRWGVRTRLAQLRLKRDLADAAPAAVPPWDPATRPYAAGRLLLAWGDARGAAQAFAGALELRPTGGYARWLGDARAEAGDGRGAEEAWEKALALDPQSAAPAALALARAAIARGDVAGAQRYLAATSAGPAFERAAVAAEIALAAGDPAAAVGQLETAARLLRSVPDPKSASERLAPLFLRAARPAAAPTRATDAVRGLVRGAPFFQEWRLLLARALLANGRDAEALAEMDAVLRSGIVWPDLVGERGLCLLRLGRRAEAAAALRELERWEPWSARAVELEERLRQP